MQKITTFLWFNDNAEEAIAHYLSIFKDGRVLSTMRNGEGGPGQKGSVLTSEFELFGQVFIALNGGPHFSFNEAVSLVVNCENQEEVDYYWEKLGEGGRYSQCGWLKDKFGLSWQIVPVGLKKALGDPDPAKARRAMDAMMKMTKLDVEAIQRAKETA